MNNETKRMLTTSLGYVGKIALMLVALSLVTSCGKKNAEGKASQSILRVNGDEITVHQLNDELQRANLQPGQEEGAGKLIMQKLLDRQLLVQEALKTKLDHNPRVMQAIENAKMQIFAQAYLEDKVSSLAKPTEAEIADYRAKHTDIFANRKIFVMDELVFVVEAGRAQELQFLSNSAKRMEEVIQWLGAHQVKYARAQAAHSAESLPPELLAKLSKMSVGDLIFINTNGRTVVGSMTEIKNLPISETDSKPLIERILTGQKRKQAAEAEIARLRSVAKIEYIDKKFDPSAGTNATSQVAKPIQQESTVEPPKSNEVANQAGNRKVESHIEKGLSGL
jgi:peptidyl-prolyl cis-trans isomerase C